MKITVLVENSSRGAVGAAHGLSLYIETAAHRILFDAGPDGDLLLRNAQLLGIDLASADIAFLSHGHYDHSGGMMAFLGVNKTAKLWLHPLAAQPHFATENMGFRYIGIDPQITETYADRLCFTDGLTVIDEELTCFSDVKTADFLSGSNLSLLEPDGGDYKPDRFLHEENLLIRENGKIILIAGCAHRGIINFLRRAEEIAGRTPDAVYAGFHLTNPGRGIDEPEAFVRSVGIELGKRPGRYYTGHCTGTGPYGILKEILDSRLSPLSGGTTFEE